MGHRRMGERKLTEHDGKAASSEERRCVVISDQTPAPNPTSVEPTLRFLLERLDTDDTARLDEIASDSRRVLRTPANDGIKRGMVAPRIALFQGSLTSGLELETEAAG